MLYCQQAPSFGWDDKTRAWLSVVIKNPRMSFKKRVGCNSGVLTKCPPLASDHHGLLVIPIHWLASSLCLFSTCSWCVWWAFWCTMQGSKLRPFWSHMLPKCNLCDSKIYLGAFVRVQIIAVVRPLQFSAKRSRITAQHVPRDRELKQVKLFSRAHRLKCAFSEPVHPKRAN